MKRSAKKFSEVEMRYRGVRNRYREATSSSVSYSVQISGTPSTHGRQYWSSILFTKLCLSAITVDRMSPHVPARTAGEIWDISSVATLVRAMAENYLLLYWLCTETDNDDLWAYRITLMSIIDNRSRYRLTSDLERSPEPEEFIQAQTSLTARLANMPLFTSLPEKRQRELLRGDRLPFIQDDVVDALSVDSASFRKLYRYLSSYVHTGTISFFRIEQQRRGTGEKNDYEMEAIGACLEFASLVLGSALRDMEVIGHTALVKH